MEKKTMLNKKGIFGLDQQVLEFLVVIIVLVVVGSILVSLKDVNTNTYAQNVSNLSVTFSGGGGAIPTSISSQDGFAWTIDQINNGTIASGGNLTFATTNVNSYSNGSIALKPGIGPAGGKFNFTFTWTSNVQDSAYNASVNGLEGQQNFSNQMPLLATILVFVAIISAVVFLANAFRRTT